MKVKIQTAVLPPKEEKSSANQSADLGAEIGNESLRICYRQQGSGSLRPGLCNIDFDSILDCIRLYPELRQYFQEKVSCIQRLESKLSNPGLRCKGENKKWLAWWIWHYKKQIFNTSNPLLKKDK